MGGIPCEAVLLLPVPLPVPVSDFGLALSIETTENGDEGLLRQSIKWSRTLDKSEAPPSIVPVPVDHVPVDVVGALLAGGGTRGHSGEAGVRRRK